MPGGRRTLVFSIITPAFLETSKDLLESSRYQYQGRIQDFKLGGALKKLRRAEGGAKILSRRYDTSFDSCKNWG
jgi:hypothetical protein